MAGMSRMLWAWVCRLGGAGMLAVLVWRLGSRPFLDGIRVISVWSLAAAAGIAVLTTVCCAWRWRVVARGLGVDLPLRPAVAACYRSQFLNTTLPFGVLGDVHRAVLHGRDVGDVGRSLRSVAWERSAGQVVQILLTMLVLLVLPSPMRSSMPAIAATAIVAVAVVAGTLGAVLLSLALRGPSRWGRPLRTAAADVRDGLLARPAWPGIVLASATNVAGHTATFLIAARTAGSTASTGRLLPLGLLVLLAAAVPTNIAGWGPREGVAAWAFSLAGLGAPQGVTTAVVYGAVVLVANLPGAALLVVVWLRRDTPGRDPTDPPRGRPAIATPEAAAHG